MLKIVALCLLIVVVVQGATVSVGYEQDPYFHPVNITIKVNDTVTWTWDGNGHNVVSGSNCIFDENFTSGVGKPSNIGFNFSWTFNETGTFPYFCQYHCRLPMSGTIFVTEDGTTAGGNGGTTTGSSSVASGIFPAAVLVCAFIVLLF